MGTPLTERVTGELKPLTDVIVIVKLLHAPLVTYRWLGDIVRVKSGGFGGGGPVTTSVTMTLWVISGDPDVPVTVKLYAPTGVAVDVRTLSDSVAD